MTPQRQKQVNLEVDLKMLLLSALPKAQRKLEFLSRRGCVFQPVVSCLKFPACPVIGAFCKGARGAHLGMALLHLQQVFLYDL